MAVVFSAWAKYIAEKKPWRAALLASRVFGVDAYNYSEKERAYKFAYELKSFFARIGLKTTLTELGIGKEDFDVMADRATRNGPVGHYYPLDKEEFKAVLELAV